MIYFRKNDEVIEKYQIDFDKEELEILKEKIIDNCSYIKHEKYESDYSPRFTDEIIKNFRCTPTGRVKEYFEETRRIDLYSYDEYKPPYLVKLINDLLKGNPTAIDKIFKYDISTKSTIENRINLAVQDFTKINSENICERKAKLKELEELLKAKELSEGQQSIELYYNQLIGLIKINLIDSLSISELGRIESFLGIKLANKIVGSDSKNKKVVKSLNRKKNVRDVKKSV